MGREVRRVPAGWVHPKDEHSGNYVPLYKGYNSAATDFSVYAEDHGIAAAVEYYGHAPCVKDYMPEWKSTEKTHYQMYETTTEGTPISPVMESPEALAHWLADARASAFGAQTASYEDWLRVCNGGFAPSAVYSPQTGLVSGVEGLGKLE